MEGYTAELTIYDERNGEIVGTLRNIQLEDDCLDESTIEEMEEFIGVSINKYEEDVWPQI